MSLREFEASNITPPLKNTAAMKCIAVVAVGTASGTTDLSTLLSKLSNGHFLTIQPDMPDAAGGRIWFAFGATADSINERATGVGNTVCYVKGDLQELTLVPVGGREVTTGVATLSIYGVLHHKGSASGYLRIYRSSLNPQESPGEGFPAP